MNMLAAAFPGSRIEKMDSRFVDNVYAGDRLTAGGTVTATDAGRAFCDVWLRADARDIVIRSAQHTSEPQSLMCTSYAVFCLNTNKRQSTPTSSNSTRTMEHNLKNMPHKT